jgi:CubicO group peptidase (beta-lactamase class C family)
VDFDGSAIAQLLNDAVDRGALAGVAAIVVSAEGPLHRSDAGTVNAGTMFRNASMTKAPATAGALQLVEQGRLDLDAKVESILPEFGDLQVLEGFDGDTLILRAPASKPTIRQLATHTAGCGYFFTSEKLHRHGELTGFPNPLSGLKSSLSTPLVNDPGTVWEYGVNVDWLGLVVQEVSGQKLDAISASTSTGRSA